MKKNIFFIIPTLESGGAQRTFLNILNHIDKSIFKCTLVLYSKKGEYLKNLNKDIDIINLNVSRSLFAIPKLALKLLIYRPEIVFSTIRYVNACTVISNLITFKTSKVIIRETNNHSAAGVKKNIKERIVSWSYRKANLVISLSNGVKKDIIKRHKVSTSKVITIYNPVDIEFINKQKKEKIYEKILLEQLNKKKLKLVTVGHLKYQKGYDLLIKSLKNIKEKISFSLLIIGDGAERKKLEKIVQQEDLEKNVYFIGHQNNPYKWIAKSDLFILSSRWEGFGHVIVESMSLGVPVISTDCESGPNEIITNNYDSFLFKNYDTKELESMLKKVNNNRSIIENIRHKAITRSKDFEVRKITKNYQEIFLNL